MSDSQIDDQQPSTNQRPDKLQPAPPNFSMVQDDQDDITSTPIPGPSNTSESTSESTDKPSAEGAMPRNAADSSSNSGEGTVQPGDSVDSQMAAVDSKPQADGTDFKVASDLSLEKFAENLLQEKDLTNVDAGTRDTMRDELVDRLQNVTNRVMLDSLPEDKLSEFEKLLDSGAEPTKLQDFISKSIPDIDTKLTDAYFDFRRLYLGL